MNVDRYTVTNMCSRKVGYRTKQAAKKVAKRINRTRATKGEGPLRIYHCPLCQYWHFTSKEKQYGKTAVAHRQRTDKQ